MYADLTHKLAELEDALLAEQEKTREAMERERLAQTRLEALAKVGVKTKEISETTLFEAKNRLNQAVKAREDLTDKHTRLADQLAVVGRENDRWKKNFLEKEVTAKIEQQLFDAEVERIKQEIAGKEQVVADLRVRKQENEAILEADAKLKEVKQRRSELTETVAAKEQELDGTAYKFLESEALHKLALKQLEFESEERRKLADEVTRLRALLDETERTIALKMQRQTREHIPVELNAAEDRLAKAQLELQDLQNRFATAHQFQTRYSLEIANLMARKERNKTDQTQLALRLKDLEESIQKEEKELTMRNQTLDDTKKRRNDIEKRLAVAKAAVEARETQAEGLKARVRFIEEKFDFGEQVRQVDIQALQQVVNSNNSVNQTIANVLQNWEAIRGLGAAGK